MSKKVENMYIRLSFHELNGIEEFCKKIYNYLSKLYSKLLYNLRFVQNVFYFHKEVVNSAFIK